MISHFSDITKSKCGPSKVAVLCEISDCRSVIVVVHNDAPSEHAASNQTINKLVQPGRLTWCKLFRAKNYPESDN